MKAIAVLLIALLSSGCAGFRLPGTGPGQVERWCVTYARGWSFVSSVVLPYLGTSPAAATARATLELANAQIVAICERQATGGEVRPGDPVFSETCSTVAECLALGSRTSADLIKLYVEAQAAPVEVTRGTGRGARTTVEAPPVVAAVDHGQLLRALWTVEYEATREKARRPGRGW